MFYEFSQNNSGGQFKGPSEIIVEADNAAEANIAAQHRAGVYFDGVKRGKDCECCGDRWSPVHDGMGELYLYADDVGVLVYYADGTSSVWPIEF